MTEPWKLQMASWVTAVAVLAFAPVSGATEPVRQAAEQHEATATAAATSAVVTAAFAAPVRATVSYNADGTVAVPVASERVMHYYHAGLVARLINVTLWFAILMLLCFGGYSARMRCFADRVTGNGFLSIPAYWVLFAILIFLVMLPLNYYTGFVMEQEAGMSTQTRTDWAIKQFKWLAVSALGGALTLWIPYLLLRKQPARWWLFVSLAAFPVLVVFFLIRPIVIDPLFNDFGPVKNTKLEQKLLNLAQRAGVDNARVFEVDTHGAAKAINVYAAGIGGSSRIVFWDTLSATLSEDQVLVVLSHEIGHHVLNHLWKSIATFMALLLISLYFVHRVAHALIARHAGRLGFATLSDIASLPLILLLFGMATTVRIPIENAVDRHLEHDADVFALELTHNNRAAAEGHVPLIDADLDNPRPHWFDQLMFGSHPTPAERIEFANTYRPWATGQPLRYGELIKPQT